MPEWLIRVLTDTLVVGFWWFVLQQYTLAKIRQRIEPLTAEETLRRQNLLNAKLQSYREACTVVCRHLAASPWKRDNVPPSRQASSDHPSEREINSCAATLALFTSDVRVRDAFMKCFQNASAADLGTFVGLLREDLGYGQSVFRPEEYPYFFGEAGQSPSARLPNTHCSRPLKTAAAERQTLRHPERYTAQARRAKMNQ